MSSSSDISARILERLTVGEVDSLAVSREWSVDHQRVVGAIKSLECLDDVVRAEIQSGSSWQLTEEGKEVVSRGSHEAVVFETVPAGDGSIGQKDLMAAVKGKDWGKVGFSKAMLAGWIKMEVDSDTGNKVVKRKVDTIEDKVRELLKMVQGGVDLSAKEKLELKKRKLLQEVTVKSYVVRQGDKFSLRVEKAEAELTSEMMATASWKSASFKPYNFNALGSTPSAGHLHPLLKVRAEYRQIFLEMGFEEMPTNNFVESSFWNFDALFVPQQHPARDAQDTFFVSNPSSASEFPREYYNRVKRVHLEGGYGSQVCLS